MKHFPILLLLISFASVTGLLFTPALPELSRAFQISSSEAQWTMSVFLFGYCLGQLPYGPLANRFGRKPTLYVGIALAFLGSLLAAFSPSLIFLCFARFLQAIGSAVGLKITFTIISDTHSGAKATKMISLLSLAFGITPGLSVALGGLITTIASWQGCFLFLALYSALLGLLSLFLPETLRTAEKKDLRIKTIASGYLRQFKDLFLVQHALIVSLATMMIYIFATLAPFIGINRIGLSPSAFGLWNLLPALGLFCGAFLSQHFANRTAPRKNILSGILTALLGTIVLELFFTRGVLTPWTLFVPQFLIQIGLNLAWTNASSKGLSEARDKSNASAVFQFINIGGPVVGVYLIGRFSPTLDLLLPSAYLIVLVLMTTLWFRLKSNTPKSKCAEINSKID